MITCKPYRAQYKMDRTCVANQLKIAEFKQRGKLKSNCSNEILSGTMLADYFKIEACDGCKIGVALYKKAKEEGRLPGPYRNNHIAINRGKRAYYAIEQYHKSNESFGR